MREIIRVGNMTLSTHHPMLIIMCEPGKAKRHGMVALCWLLAWAMAITAVAPYGLDPAWSPAIKVLWCCSCLSLATIGVVAGNRLGKEGPLEQVLLLDEHHITMGTTTRPIDQVMLAAKPIALGHRVQAIAGDQCFDLGWTSIWDEPTPLLRVLRAHMNKAKR